MKQDDVAFSGSSGGALVACALCCGIDIDTMTEHIIETCQPQCIFNPWKMLPCADEALRIFLPTYACKSVSNRLRVLVTRFELRWGRPLVRPQVVSTFGSHAELRQILRASCHIPLLGGLLPYQVQGEDGKARGAFYDGLFWPSILYTWRVFGPTDTLLKVSGIGWPTAHVALPLPVPPHWTMLPPSRKTLWRLYQAGQDDTARYFARHGRPKPSASLFPSPSDLPPAPPRRDLKLLFLVAVGWLHLLVLTIFAPCVPVYLFVRNLTHTPSSSERRPSTREPATSSGSAGDVSEKRACEGLRTTLQYLLRAFVVMLVLALWPLALLVLGLRVLHSHHMGESMPTDLWSIPGLSPPMTPPESTPSSPRPSRTASRPISRMTTPDGVDGTHLGGVVRRATPSCAASR
jgi:hypothetical protein